VGVPLPRRLVTARGVRLAVARVLDDPRFRDRARALGEWARRHGNGSVAADVLEDFATLK
jgi:UDP:flavonoid glycosyltransferase YjiC (YdhE family)